MFNKAQKKASCRKKSELWNERTKKLE